MTLAARLRAIRKGPLAVAGILAPTLFFCSLMCASLAIARPRIVTWTHKGHLVSRFHAPAADVEARIWLWSLVPFAAILAIGLLACLWRYGVYLSCAAGVVLPLGVTHRLPTWERHHAVRWPRGIDNIPDKWSSDQVSQGSWEHDSAVSAFSLSHYTIGFAIAIAIVYTAVLYRRVRARQRVAQIDAAAETVTV